MFLLNLVWLLFAPDVYYTPLPSECRIHNTTFTQKGCGACSAFALATAASMHLCIDKGIDRIPSPYRMFDCGGGRCGRGRTVISLYSALGVGDVRDSPRRFGLPCPNRPDEVASISEPYARR